MKKLIKHLDLIVTLTFAGAAAVALISPYIDPAKNWLYAFFALIFPWLYGLNFLMVIYWGIRLWRRRHNRVVAIIFPVIILIWGWFSPARIYQFHFFAQAGKEQPTMRLMSYNMHSLVNMKKAKKEAEFKKFITEKNPDIIFGQECSLSTAKYVADILHYHYARSKTKKSTGTAIISRFPILDSGQKRFYKSGNSYSWADIEVHHRKIRFFSIHLQSNAISTEANYLSKDPDLQKRKTWSRMRKILALYRMTAKQRTEQAKEVKSIAAQSPYPVFFCGDFNDPPLANSYHILAENKLDSFTERGKGIGTTYPGLTPNLRIDYILAPNSFRILSHRVLKVSYSDHYPVMADIAWSR